MEITDCKGCNSTSQMCTALYKLKGDNIIACPCPICIVKMICKEICQEYTDYYIIDVTEEINKRNQHEYKQL